MRVSFERYLEVGSSPVDWCEPNYEKSSEIAEFYNTISNIIYLLGPPVLVYLHADYAKWISSAIYVVWWFYIIIGLASAYFHATLSLLGQLLDELAILWTYMMVVAAFCPRRYRFEPFKDRQDLFSGVVGIVTLLLSVLSFYHPAINALALMVFTVPTFIMYGQYLKRNRNQKVNDLIVRTLILLGFAILVWVNDRFFCDVWIELKFAYLHAVWHILIFIATYGLCVVAAYVYALEEKPEWKPRISYWPNERFELGIPFVALKTPDHLI